MGGGGRERGKGGRRGGGKGEREGREEGGGEGREGREGGGGRIASVASNMYTVVTKHNCLLVYYTWSVCLITEAHTIDNPHMIMRCVVS